MADADTTPLRTCKKHGEHDDWSRRKPHGKHILPELRCRPCDREAYHARKVRPWHIAARHKAQVKAEGSSRYAREQYRRAAHIALLEQYGPDVAARYQSAIAADPDRRITVKSILRQVVVEAHPSLDLGKAWERVLLLNAITERSLTNVGWSCRSCFIESDDHGFFDVDHIVPCSVIGKRSERDKSNLQLLCPNCHRCKTRGSPPWFEVERDAA